MIVSSRVLVVLLIAFCFGVAACGDAETKPTPPSARPPATSPPVEKPVAVVPKPAEEPAADDPAALAQRGSAVYTANCIACHNTDPAIDGAIGPAIAGASLELLEARVLRNEYPAGYKPKRDTKAMIPLPYLEKDLPALVAFLAR